jgi:hypothetical protein
MSASRDYYMILAGFHGTEVKYDFTPTFLGLASFGHIARKK